jgi:hypothetical protein
MQMDVRHNVTPQNQARSGPLLHRNIIGGPSSLSMGATRHKFISGANTFCITCCCFDEITHIVDLLTDCASAA